MFHTKVIGTRSRNLDTFFTGRDVTRYLLRKNGAGADVAVIEGVMGYYDGLAGISAEASAWELADVTDTPAVLLVNCRGMSVSIVPMIKGFLEYKENSHIRGVILNRISPMLYPRVKAMVEDGRDCSEVLVQLAAVRSALNNTGKVILKDHLEHCIVDAVQTQDFAAIDELNRAIEQFVK